MHEVSVINPLEIENWNNLLASTPGSSFFHTANWVEVLYRSYGYRPIYLCETHDNSLESLLPIMEVDSTLTGKNGVCLPFSDICEPIAQNTQHFQNVFDQAVILGKQHRWKYIEIRGGDKFLSEQQSSHAILSHSLDLTCGSKQLFLTFRDSTRRNIKKAQKEKIEIRISNSFDDLKAFCLLNDVTRKRHGLPPQPFNFFRNLYNNVLSQDMGFITTASLNNRAIASNIYFNFGKEIIFKYGASHAAFHHLRANNLVMWEAIKWSCERGFARMCFGRTEPEHTGLMQYKAGWGAKPFRINYYKYSLQKNCFITDSPGINPFLTRAFSRLPIPVLKLFGKILYRHMG